jgi:hypothetical protein
MENSMWLYNDKEFTPEQIENNYGFVYIITNLETNKKYIGKKFFTKAGTKQIKGKRKKIRKTSDWESYWGSNKTLLEEIEKNGTEKYKKEIIKLCISRGECSYWESYYIFTYHALRSDLFYNEWVSCKIRKNHLKS